MTSNINFTFCPRCGIQMNPKFQDLGTKAHIEVVAKLLNEAIAIENDIDESCRLQNARELIRRAWHQLDGTPCEENDLIKVS